MKKLIMVGALLTAVFTTSAFAVATMQTKKTDANPAGTNANGVIGALSSSGTGNGAVIGGHGNMADGTPYGGPADQTTGPSSRSQGVQAALGHTN